ncbi:YsnF/AvaK domain-containing protein [Clostridium sp. DJ247]|uniref:YsnF/AvaK domain-containing protein n=1 Tax=Clostridium sp. DJ247 TaxID=2726188 RepID=UPI001629D4C8|nr:YsnF/AvaK domain-containing protein [Clostridium sp. DJ247]MBC2582612.1 YsnF/AvaK domain-containing protein [Clostridium sp. DJ247]
MLKKSAFNQDRGHITKGNDKISKQLIDDTNNSAKLQLREEQLDIAKKWIQTGQVTMHKEVFTEEKNITVPVTREELVIEKKVLDGKAPNKMDRHTEKIRIPISEERIEVIKHPLVLEDVEIYKHQFQETECIEKTLKKEQIHLETTGDPKIIDKEVEKQ